MRGSFKILSAFGININIHITFLILPFLATLGYGAKGLFLVLFLFTCVTLHELTHSLVAKRFGIVVKDITLLPIGGVASMSSSPETPRHEFLISIAGPLFNIVLAALLYYPLIFLIGPQALFSPSLATWPQALAHGFWINLLLAGFNLIPAFPMDGGRVLRAILASRMDIKKATSIAVNVGHFFALAFAYVGLVKGPITLLLIAFFVYGAASAEGAQVDVRETIKGFKVADVLPRDFLTLKSDIPLSKVIELVFHSHQNDFPVVDNGKMVGFLTREDIMVNIHQNNTGKSVGEVMRREFPTASPGGSLADTQKIMDENQMKSLPVVDGGKVMGVITFEDISRVYSVMSKRR